MLSCNFSPITKKTCQKQHKTLPPHTEWTQLQGDNSPKLFENLIMLQQMVIQYNMKKYYPPEKLALPNSFLLL